MVVSLERLYEIQVPLCARCFWRRLIIGVASYFLVVPWLLAFVALAYVLMAKEPEPIAYAVIAPLVLLPFWLLTRVFNNIDLRYVGAREGALMTSGEVEVFVRNELLARAVSFSYHRPIYFPERRWQGERGTWWYKWLLAFFALMFAWICKSELDNPLQRARPLDKRLYWGAEWLLKHYGPNAVLIPPLAVGIVLIVWGIVQAIVEWCRRRRLSE